MQTNHASVNLIHGQPRASQVPPVVAQQNGPSGGDGSDLASTSNAPNRLGNGRNNKENMKILANSKGSNSPRFHGARSISSTSTVNKTLPRLQIL